MKLFLSYLKVPIICYQSGVSQSHLYILLNPGQSGMILYTCISQSRNSNFYPELSLQNQSFQITPKLFLELDNDVFIMFPKWF